MSAHGLPEKIVEAGDPYRWQIERMGAALATRLPRDWEVIGCFQSRVGPMTWIGPSTEEIVRQASQARRNIIIAPIAFVSEHVETLVELDIEYCALAKKGGASSYIRVPALGTYPNFIALLA
jgi:ferrochelatase